MNPTSDMGKQYGSLYAEILLVSHPARGGGVG